MCKKGGFGGLFIKLLIMETFWVVKKADFSAHARPLGEEKFFGCQKSRRFQLMQDQPIKKSFF